VVQECGDGGGRTRVEEGALDLDLFPVVHRHGVLL
jgi:hypothetical protein